MLAATNRSEILDPALLRPGRFDRRVAVQPPDRAGRRAILAVHTRSIPLADTVNLDALAASTQGWSERTWRTSPTRPRCSRPGASMTGSSGSISTSRWKRSCSGPCAGSCSPRWTASGPPTTKPATMIGRSCIATSTPPATTRTATGA